MDETRRGPGEWMIPTAMLARTRELAKRGSGPRVALRPEETGPDGFAALAAVPGPIVLIDSPGAREALDDLMSGEPGGVLLNTVSAVSLGLAVRELRGDPGKLLVVDCAADPAWVSNLLSGPDLSGNRIVIVAPEGTDVAAEGLDGARVVRVLPEPVAGPRP